MSNRDNAFTLPIRIAYRPPRSVLYLAIFIHIGAILCLHATSLPVLLKLLLGSTVVCQFLLILRDHQLRHAASVAPELCLARDDSWLLLDGEEELGLELCQGALVHRLLLVMRFNSDRGKVHTFLLTRENVDKQVLRRLRVRLLHGGAATPGVQ